MPVPNEEPPEDAAYQLIVPVEAVAPRLKVPSPQRDAGVEPVIAGTAFTVAVTADLLADVHPLLSASA